MTFLTFWTVVTVIILAFWLSNVAKRIERLEKKGVEKSQASERPSLAEDMNPNMSIRHF